MKKMMFLFITVSFLFTGCWDAIETEQLGIITIMGIGLGNDNNLRVVIQEKPHEKQMQGQSSGAQAPFLIYEGTGTTISEVLNSMPANQHHRLYFAHTKAVILSEDFIRQKGIKPIIDFYERNPQIRLSTWLLIVPKGQLDKIMSTDIGINADTGTVLEETIDNQRKDSFFTVNNLNEFIEIQNKSGSELYTAGIRTGTPGGTGGGIESFNTKFDIETTAVFKNDKMVGWLSDEEHRGLSLFYGNAKGGVIEIPYEEKMIALRIDKIKSKVQPLLKDDKEKIGVTVQIEAKIIESQYNNNYMDDRIIKKVEKLFADEVIKQLMAVVNKSRELDSDFLGFGNCFNMKYPMYWKKVEKDWYSHFSDVEVNMNVRAIVKNIGKIYKPYKR